jgi:aldose 1-epimerase
VNESEKLKDDVAAASLLHLAAGPLELVLAPGIGGSIARFDYRDENRKLSIFRGSDGVPDTPLGAGSFPLVPYCNRIRDGRFSFRGREIVIPRNLEQDASPLHGDGWLAPWTVESVSARDAVLHFNHEKGDWPWDYEARQLFRLDSGGLQLTLTCTNLSDEPMPCGLGQHPYFHCTPETIIDTHVTDAWTIDDKVLPVERVPAEGRYDLRQRRVCGQDLDNGFAGWGQHCRISDPALPFTVSFSSAEAHFFQVYSPAEGGIFVAEPVTHANAVMNEPEERWPALGFRVLEPGEEMRLDVRFDVSPRA